MADTTVDAAVDPFTDDANGLWGPYWVDSDTGVVIFLDGSGNLNARKTTDGGATWAAAVEAGTEVVHHLACVFDREVVDDTGDKVHAAYMNTANDLRYTAYDISANTWSTKITVGVITENALTRANNGVVITKSRSGNLGIAAHNGGSGAILTKKSTNAGADWSLIANWFDASSSHDAARHAYCNTGDPNDMAIIYWDVSAGHLRIRVYDDSEDTVSNVLLSGGVDDTDTTPQQRSNLSTATRHHDGHVLVAAFDEEDSVTADMRVWDVNVNSVSAPTVTVKTDVGTNIAEGGSIAIFVDQRTADVYCAYSRGGTWLSAVTVYYKKSTDGMATWGSELAMQEDAAADIRALRAGYAGPGGGRFQPVWFNDDLNDLFVNLTNDVVIAPGILGSGKGSGGKGKGGNTPGPGGPPKKPLRTSLSKSWKWDRGWR
jgi:hypothetical protein